MESIKLQFKPKLNDHLKAENLYYSKSIFAKPDEIVGALLVGFGVFLLLFYDFRWWYIPFIIVGVSEFLDLLSVERFVERLVVRISFHRNPKLSEEYTLEFREDGLVFKTPSFNSHIAYSYYHKMMENDDLFLLIYGRRMYLVIPKSAFKDLDEIDRFKQLVIPAIGEKDKGPRHLKSLIKDYTKAIKTNPYDDEAHDDLGCAYYDLQKYDKAIKSFQQAIRIEPDYAKAHYDLGWAYYDLQKYDKAIKSFQQAIRIKPDYAEAHYVLGWVYNKLEDYKKAIESYKEAIRIEPDYAQAHANLERCLSYYLSKASLRAHDSEEGIEQLKEIIRLKPDYAEAHHNLGYAYRKLEDYKKAIESYKEAIRIKPDYAEAHHDLGDIYIMTKNRDGALGEYNILQHRLLNIELAEQLLEDINNEGWSLI